AQARFPTMEDRLHNPWRCDHHWQSVARRNGRSRFRNSALRNRHRMKTRYELIIYWSKDDESFVVEVPELPGCMADGQTYAEAVANAEIVIDEWIETARKLGRPIPEPRGKLAHELVTGLPRRSQ